MKSLLKKTAISLAAAFLIFAAVPTISLALDCSRNNLTAQEAIQCGVNGASGNNETASESGKRANRVVESIINLLSLTVGVIAVIMIIIGGLRYVTSAGNETAIKSARNTIMYAVIGLIIVALAQVIVKFVLTNITDDKPAVTNSDSRKVDPDGEGRRGGR